MTTLTTTTTIDQTTGTRRATVRPSWFAVFTTLARRRFALSAHTPREILVPLLTPILFADVIAPALPVAREAPQLRSRLEELTASHAALKANANQVASRLDDAIVRLARLLDSPQQP